MQLVSLRGGHERGSGDSSGSSRGSGGGRSGGRGAPERPAIEMRPSLVMKTLHLVVMFST